MIPEPRPSKDCGACETFVKDGYKECYCFCHKIGNLMNGFHHTFSAIDTDIVVGESKSVLKWG